ncbi:ABC transporter substrate-binding protein [Streptomyces specialis]|uniref:ABC transporter substrate-binding protein n=1 Tax=Streptomyces specialis TaxID=498367 RepID=UPI00073F43BD|nr:ABC transporter substrate-binding protein [Streptomyces specialis]
MVCVLLASTVLLAGCGADTPEENEGADPPAAGFPVTVTDCDGRETEVSEPPERIVTANGSVLELLLRLGAGDRVLGTGYPPGRGTLPGELDARAQQVPVLGETVIDSETLLGSGADLYISTFVEMHDDTGTFPSDEEMAAAGIDQMVLASSACAPGRDEPQTDLSAVQRDIELLGRLTGTSERAAELVAEMDATLAEVGRTVAGVGEEDRPSYFFFDYDAGTEQPMAVCNRQVGNAVITLAGARNIFADCEADFRPVGWEDVVAADPDWIQLAVRDRGSAEATEAAYDEAEAFLRDFAATAGLSAVREGRFLRVPSEMTTVSGVTNADAVARIARTLHPEAAATP